MLGAARTVSVSSSRLPPAWDKLKVLPALSFSHSWRSPIPGFHQSPSWGPVSPSSSPKICVTTLRRADVRLMCIPSGLSASQISKEKRNHLLASKKRLKALKNEVLQELVSGLVLQNTSGAWGGDFPNCVVCSAVGLWRNRRMGFEHRGMLIM